MANTSVNTKCQLSASESCWPRTNVRSFVCLDLMLTAVLALEMREVSKIVITGNFYKNSLTSSFKFVFHEKWLLFKRLDFNNCTEPNKVHIELKISKINNRIDLN